MIWENLLIGGLVVPLVLFLTILLFGSYREKKGLGEIPPKYLSLIVMLLTFISWMITGFNILIHLFWD